MLADFQYLTRRLEILEKRSLEVCAESQRIIARANALILRMAASSRGITRAAQVSEREETATPHA